MNSFVDLANTEHHLTLYATAKSQSYATTAIKYVMVIDYDAKQITHY